MCNGSTADPLAPHGKNRKRDQDDHEQTHHDPDLADRVIGEADCDVRRMRANAVAVYGMAMTAQVVGLLCVDFTMWSGANQG